MKKMNIVILLIWVCMFVITWKMLVVNDCCA